jgi:predicted rRNA methylase YqxC with S4 and FtsJ domains
MTYKPKNYWQNRLKNNFKLRGVGHLSFDDFYNQWLYKAKIRTLEKALGTQGITIADKTVCDIGCGTGFFVEFVYHSLLASG